MWVAGRRVVTLDARNHGDSPHTPTMSYPSMAADLNRLIQVLLHYLVTLYL
jgi:abhydrolase domain-containing protein 11